MKIVFFYQYFGTPKGSWSTRVYELCKRWVTAGHDVTVVTAPYDKSDIVAHGLISKISIDGIKLIVVNSGDSNRFSTIKRVFRAIQFSIFSIWYSLTLKYDVCVASSGPITIGMPMIFAKIFRGKPTVFEVRDLWPAGGIEMGLINGRWQQRLALWFEKLCYRKADHVVTASKGQKKHIIKRFPDLTIEVIPNASDLELFGAPQTSKLPEWTQGMSLFTHIGSLGLIHNTRYWFEVAVELNKIPEASNIILVFIGDGKDRETLIKESRAFNLQNIRFLGLKPKHELPHWVQASISTLFSTVDNEVQNACSPNKIFDSFAAGVPIVQTSTGWIGEMVTQERCGVNVSIQSPEEAAKKILWLSNNPDEVKIMGDNAYRLAKTDFNRDILAEKYLAIITSLKFNHQAVN